MIIRCLALTLLLPALAFAGNATDPRLLHSIPYDLVLSFETLTFPKSADPIFPGDVAGTPEKIGLAGLGMNLYLPSGFYFGPTFYAATTGKRAGFIVVGLTGGFVLKLSSAFNLLADVYIGAGGGGRVERGTGLEVRPAISLNLNVFKNLSVGVGYSKIAFNDSEINSNQAFVRVALSSDFIYESFDYASHPDTKEVYTGKFNKKWRFQPLIRNLNVQDKKLITGAPETTTATLFGGELDNFITNNLYFDLNLLAPTNGGINGFMLATAGLGYRLPLSRHFALDGKLNIGSAGGGNVDTGGGFVTETQAGIEMDFNDEQGVRASVGYLAPAEGTFFVPFLEASYVASFEASEKSHRSTDLRFTASNQRYFNYLSNGDFDFLGLEADYLWSKNFFFNAESIWSYGGKDVGTTYASALLGFGVMFPMWNHAHGELKGGIGTSAGGLPQNDIIISKTTATISQEFSHSVTGIIEGGSINSFHKTLGSAFIGIGLRIQIGMPMLPVTIRL